MGRGLTKNRKAQKFLKKLKNRQKATEEYIKKNKR